MPVKIRLQRRGRRKKPFYHIVVADARAPRDGKFIEKLGIYNPMTSPATIDIDREKAYEWLMNGAQPTDTARAILRFKGVLYLKHLRRGVKKGAFTEEQADVLFQEWLSDKEGRIRARQDASAAKAQAEIAALAGAKAKVQPVEEVAPEAPAEEVATEAVTEEAATTEAPAEEAAPVAEEAAPEAPAEEAAPASVDPDQAAIEAMLEPALVEYANSIGIDAKESDLKADTLAKVLAKRGFGGPDKAAIEAMLEPALVEYANSIGIDAKESDLKADTLAKVLEKRGL